MAAKVLEVGVAAMGDEMSISYDLACDYCGTIVAASGRSAAQARRDAKDQGLIFKSGRNEYCAGCIGRVTTDTHQPVRGE